ncbi:MAG: sulfatase/phosphatase domain-containing protein [Actinomycetota bacterium]
MAELRRPIRRSLLPLVRHEETGWRHSLMCEFHGDEFGLYSQRMLRKERYKLVYNPNDVRELYDLEADPFELHNLSSAPEYRELRRALEGDLLQIMHETEDPLRQWAVNVLA